MLAFRRVLVTALLAWIFVVGPLLAIAAGMALLASISPTLIKRLEKVGKEEAKTAEAVTPLKDREPTGISAIRLPGRNPRHLETRARTCPDWGGRLDICARCHRLAV